MKLNINDINQMLLFVELVSKCDNPELREPYEQVRPESANLKQPMNKHN